MKFTWLTSGSLNVLTGHRPAPHSIGVPGATADVTVTDAAGVTVVEPFVGDRAGEAKGVVDGEPSLQAASSRAAASQQVRIRTQIHEIARTQVLK